jgi:GMP synthase (glutamine-hydrolysing)
MILILDCGSSKSSYIYDCVDQFQDCILIPLFDFKIEQLETATGVIISGAPILITEIDTTKYLDHFQWIKEAKIPILGICFGHQIIGLIYGAEASKMKEDRDWQLIEIYEECILFNKLPNEIEMMEDHCETISIPPNFRLIGSSDACINEVMAHNSLPIFGVQFHPEVSGNHGRIVIENFTNICI